MKEILTTKKDHTQFSERKEEWEKDKCVYVLMNARLLE